MTINRLLGGAALAATALGLAAPASAQRIGNIVAFGDSYADDGNFFQLVGINPVTGTQGVYTTGRFSGGTNYIDSLAQILNATVENFAIGGALTDNRNTNGPPLGFVTEYNAFLSGGGGVAFPVTDGRFDSTDLLAVSIGGNDARFYQQTGGTLAGATAAATTSAGQARIGLDRLVAAGAQNISFLAGDTGRLPEITSNPTGAAIRSQFSSTFNAALQPTLAGYAANGVIVHYLDLNKLLDNVAAAPSSYGITNGLVCPAFPNSTCVLNSSGYLFYGDQLHLTSDGFRIVARYVAAQLSAPLQMQASSDLGLDVARQFGRTLSTRMDLGSPRDGDMPEGLGVYLVGDSVTRKLGASMTNDQFRTTSVGATIGAEYGFGSGLVGIAGNVSRPKVNFGNDQAKVDSRSMQVGVYAAAAIAGGFVQGYAGYGRDEHELSRVGVVNEIEADADGSHALAGAKAGFLFPAGVLRVGPVVALDYARAKVDGYTEQGDPVLDLNVGKARYSSLRGSIGAEVRGDFAAGGVQVRPYGAAAVEADFTGDGRAFRFAQTSAPTIVNRFAVEDASKNAYGRLTAGLSATVLSNVSVNAAISGTVRKDQGNETSGFVGLRAAF